MSFDYVKGISIQQDKVFLNSAANNVSPRHFESWECTSFSKVLAEEGKEALYARIGENVWNGNFHLLRGNKLCNLFLAATNAFPDGLSFHNYDGQTAGKYLGKMVSALEQDPKADLSPIVKEAMALMNDRNYILETAQRTGHNFLNFASPELQKDRDFALQVLKAGGKCAWFSYPKAYSGDKAFAMEALQLNGCFYRNLDESLRSNREIILAAFKETAHDRFHEHLPDVCPPMTFFEFQTDPLRPTLDKEFLYQLMDACPSIHMNRAPWLLEDRDIALKWAQVGKFFPFSVSDLPKKYLKDPEFQDALCARFQGTDKFDTLLQRFAVEGILFSTDSLESKIRAAQAKKAVEREAGSNTKPFEPER